MAVFFRALVMLVTLVGLPAAWIYYGPLPAGPQKVVDRFVEVAKDTLGWKSNQMVGSMHEFDKTPPRYEEVLPTPEDNQAVSRTFYQGQLMAPVSLVSASEEAPTTTPAVQDLPGSNLAVQIEPHLNVLREMGAANYSLEEWGNGYRFKCAVSLGNNMDFTRHFEAIDADPLATVRQVVGEVTAWQNARHESGATTTMWR
jgi:hypothetical protein